MRIKLNDRGLDVSTEQVRFDLFEPSSPRTTLAKRRFCAAFEYAQAHYFASQPTP